VFLLVIVVVKKEIKFVLHCLKRVFWVETKTESLLVECSVESFDLPVFLRAVRCIPSMRDAMGAHEILDESRGKLRSLVGANLLYEKWSTLQNFFKKIYGVRCIGGFIRPCEYPPAREWGQEPFLPEKRGQVPLFRFNTNYYAYLYQSIAQFPHRIVHKQDDNLP